MVSKRTFNPSRSIDTSADPEMLTSLRASMKSCLQFSQVPDRQDRLEVTERCWIST